MNIFLDTSSLIKLYFFEEGTILLETFLSENDINFIFLSEISKLEFESTLWKKVRTKELEEQKAKLQLMLLRTIKINSNLYL